MKNLSLFVTLGLISLMGAFAPVNAEPLEGEASNPIDTSETLQLEDKSTIDSNGNVLIEEQSEMMETSEEPLDNESAEIPTPEAATEAVEPGTDSVE